LAVETPVPEIADIVAALVALLIADASVAAIAGGRVFGDELPETENAAMPRAALVVVASGGPSLTGGSNAEHDTARVDLFGYGATQEEANRLIATAALSLRRIQRVVSAGTLIHWARPAGGATGARDAQLAWPRAFQSFQVFHALQEVQ
jgi:hypothetical protein